MAPPLNLTQAAKCVGVSRNTLYAAIRSGRLTCALGGRPGAKTLVTPEALHEAGFAVPEDLLHTERSDERLIRSERSERSQRPERPGRAERSALAELSDSAEIRSAVQQFERAVEHLERSMEAMTERLGERLERSIERALERVVERSVERLLDRRAREALPVINVPSLAPVAAGAPSGKSAILDRLRTMKADGLSLQAMANRLNDEGIPTLSGRGRWQKGTIANLLAERSYGR
jgi:helix-turn-helix protein/recombinase